jgi:hypothetical protein
MPPLPAQDLRSNLATWAVPAVSVPAIASRLLSLLPREKYDPAFTGQELETTYFDTPGLALRKARNNGSRYLTLRIRRYQPSGSWAFSAKTEQSKYRIALDPERAHQLLVEGFAPTDIEFLPPNLLARLIELAEDSPLVPVVTVCFQRYAVEDADNRLTFDLTVRTDTGKCFPAAVLEHKATDANARPYAAFPALGLRPIKLSKFLWSTRA